MKNRITLLLLVYCLLSIVPFSYADYVLPYPSFMPGNKMYRISRVIDNLKANWYFGNIAKTKYHLGLSDKYLVEAKTLFEYKQYLLAVDALKRSNDHFEVLPQFIKNDTQKNIVREAGGVHIRVLEELASKLPEEFIWKPEKSEESVLYIGSLIRQSKGLRLAVKDYVTH